MPLLPPNIELVVNGTEAQVKEALTKRGFHPSDVLRITDKRGVCEVLVKLECEPGVERWFKEQEPISSPGCVLSYQK